jgi:hypothetical protein
MKEPKSNSQPHASFNPTATEGVLPPGNSLAGGADIGVDKIRDLLFGNQMHDYDRRFSEMEERFLQRFKDLESETTRNLSTFESSTKKHIWTRSPANSARRRNNVPRGTRRTSVRCASRARRWRSASGSSPTK